MTLSFATPQQMLDSNDHNRNVIQTPEIEHEQQNSKNLIEYVQFISTSTLENVITRNSTQQVSFQTVLNALSGTDMKSLFIRNGYGGPFI